MNVVEKVVALASKLPASVWHLFVGIVDTILSAKSAKEAEDKLRKAALAVGYKASAREAMKAATNARSKL